MLCVYSQIPHVYVIIECSMITYSTYICSLLGTHVGIATCACRMDLYILCTNLFISIVLYINNISLYSWTWFEPFCWVAWSLPLKAVPGKENVSTFISKMDVIWTHGTTDYIKRSYLFLSDGLQTHFNLALEKLQVSNCQPREFLSH